jgi:alanine dehydrogenase
VDGIVHYCVANMPGAVARSSTIALTSVTLPFGLQIASLGLRAAAKANEPLRRGINTIDGKCVHPGVAKALGVPYTEYGY